MRSNFAGASVKIIASMVVLKQGQFCALQQNAVKASERLSCVVHCTRTLLFFFALPGDMSAARYHPKSRVSKLSVCKFLFEKYDQRLRQDGNFSWHQGLLRKKLATRCPLIMGELG